MPKLLFDQNLSYRIIKNIGDLFPESKHVARLKLDKADDLALWQYAKDNDFHIVSKDTDFNDINTLYGFPPKIIWIQTGNTSTKNIIEIIRNKSKVIQLFLEDTNTGILKI